MYICPTCGRSTSKIGENMSHIYEASEWKIGDRWYVNDVKELATSASKWWQPMQMLDMSIEQYTNLLISYNAKKITYHKESDVLTFSFDTQSEARKFKNFLNREARKRNWICGA